MTSSHRLGRIFFTGLLLLVPAWTTFLILAALFETLDSFLLNLIGHQIQPYAPGLGILLLIGMVLMVGAIATQVIGQRFVRWAETTLEGIPLIRSIYLTLKSMTDLLNYRARFGQSTVVAFPFPRDGLWALGFVSLFMDLSSEMIHSLLPLFMVGTLGASALVVGLIEGLAEATALIVKVFSGVLSDWWGKRKGLAVAGYALGAATALGVAASSSRPLPSVTRRPCQREGRVTATCSDAPEACRVSSVVSFTKASSQAG